MNCKSNIYVGFAVLILVTILGSCTASNIKSSIDDDDYDPTLQVGPIKFCRKDLPDLQLSACTTKSILDLRPNFAAGIPEIGLNSIDPFRQSSFDFSLNLWPLIVHLKLTNITVTHLSEFDVQHLFVNTAAKTFSFAFAAPIVRLELQYKIDGNLPILRAIGSGGVNADFINGVSKGEWSFKIGEDSKGVKIIQIDTLKDFDLDFETAKFEIGGIFGSHPTLKRTGALINRLTNQYSHEFWEIIKPALLGPIGNIVNGIANPVFAKMPVMAEYF